MKCTQCHNQEATIGLFCAKCVEANKQRHVEMREAAFSSRHSDRDQSSGLLRYLRPVGIATLSLLVGIVAYRHLTAVRVLPYVPLETNMKRDLKPCSGKEQCLVVLVTPWCPSCKAAATFLGAFRTLTTHQRQLGLQVITSMDTKENLLASSEIFRVPLHYDIDKEFARQIGSVGVPHWWTINDKREIQKSGSGLPSSFDESQFVNYVTTKLGISLQGAQPKKH